MPYCLGKVKIVILLYCIVIFAVSMISNHYKHENIPYFLGVVLNLEKIYPTDFRTFKPSMSLISANKIFFWRHNIDK